MATPSTAPADRTTETRTSSTKTPASSDANERVTRIAFNVFVGALVLALLEVAWTFLHL